MHSLPAALSLGATLLAGTMSPPQSAVDGFIAKSFKARSGEQLPYRLFVPPPEARGRSLPIVIYLHGGGGAGTDNLAQISGGNTLGTHVWTAPEVQSKHPAFVLAPQLPGDNQWSAPESAEVAPWSAVVLELLVGLSREYRIDSTRVYLVGQSRGGRGVWDLVAKRPSLFAAAIPVCGDGDASRISAARTIPIWAFHGALDDVVPVSGSRALVNALKAAGSTTIRYTEYAELGHNVWNSAFREAGLTDWLFQQQRTR